MKKDLFSEYNKIVRDKPVVFESQSVILPNGIIVECEEDRIFGNVIVTARMVGSKEIYAIQVDRGTTKLLRRTRILNKLRGAGTTTKQMIQNVAESFSNGQVEIVEYNDLG